MAQISSARVFLFLEQYVSFGFVELKVCPKQSYFFTVLSRSCGFCFQPLVFPSSVCISELEHFHTITSLLHHSVSCADWASSLVLCCFFLKNVLYLCFALDLHSHLFHLMSGFH